MTKTVKETASREIVHKRILNAPRELVWKVWTDPKHVAEWWGPNGFTNTIHEMTVKPGGVWRFMMHAPNGMNFPNKIVFDEVVKPERLVYTHSSEDENDPNIFHTIVTFEEQRGKTLLTMRGIFATAEERERVIKEYGALEGGKQTLNRLEEHLSKMLEGKEFVVTRVFNAPRKLVWKAFSESEALAQWWGPKGSNIKISKLDFRPDGIFHYSMESPMGVMWGKFKYLQMDEPERLVFINFFSDKDGNVTRAPFSENWPLEIMNILTLNEKDGKTTLTLRGGPINATEAEQKAFNDMFGGMQQGFAGTFDQLDEYLAKAGK